jgi:glycine dehydrogenase subunit 2
MFRQARWEEPLLNELDREGRVGFTVPVYREIRAAVGAAEALIPRGLLREAPPPLPRLSEPQVVRHFTHLAEMNFGVDSGTYPLGSCTMKYNPKLCNRVAANPVLRRLHPYQPEESVQGLLSILHHLAELLAEITGTFKVSLAPAAGAQGEFVGALIMRAYARDRGEERDEVLVPDSAHGTNPASAAMAGFRVVKIPSTEEGLIDVEAVKATVSSRTAGMMLTVPNTLGLFERDIVEVAGVVHDAGGLMYYDGANMNALLGRVRPGDMGFDIVHLNLHKTFATPHGGGGPGAGPVGVVKELADYLPIPLIGYDGRRYFLDYSPRKSVGRIRGFVGNIGVLVRAYAYLRLLGREGLKEASGQAVLAANYLWRRLNPELYQTPHRPETPRKHEFVVSVNPLKEQAGVRALEVAKALLDQGVHAPTIYFPLIVEEALMVEPTESEPLEALDQYAEALNSIGQTALQQPDGVKDAPRNTAVGRLDEVKASHPRTLTLTWRKLKQDGSQGV